MQQKLQETGENLEGCGCLLSRVSGQVVCQYQKKKKSFLEVLHLVTKTKPALRKGIKNHVLAKYTNYSM
jgi:hypothetical protein